jgi:hypothetical protein
LGDVKLLSSLKTPKLLLWPVSPLLLLLRKNQNDLKLISILYVLCCCYFLVTNFTLSLSSSLLIFSLPSELSSCISDCVVCTFQTVCEIDTHATCLVICPCDVLLRILLIVHLMRLCNC